MALELARRFGGELVTTVQSVVPSEIYLDTSKLWDNGGATLEDVFLKLTGRRLND